MDEISMLRKIVAIKGVLDFDIEWAIKQKGTVESTYKQIQGIMKEE